MKPLQEALSFDDVLVKPVYSEIESRLSANTETIIGGIPLKIPLISSPMDTVTEAVMAIELGKLGGMGVMHRFLSSEDQIEMTQRVIDYKEKNQIFIPVVPSVGVTESEMYRFEKLHATFGNKIDMIAVDVANGYSSLMEKMIKFIKTIDPKMPIMAGNVATKEGYKFLSDLGVNAVRVGIGGGSICKTRIQTSFGVPTLFSLIDCNEFKNENVSIIADGGIKYPADLVKSLVAGADAIICGSIFAGTKEAPGDVIHTNDGKAWKKYRGMASEEMQEERRGGLKPGTVAEGVSQLTEYKGSLDRVVTEFVGGLKSGMSYGNCKTIKDLRALEFIRITNSGIIESHAHGTQKR